MNEFLFGKLSLAALPHEWYTIGGTLSIIFGMILMVIFISYKKRWGWLWNDWLTSCDPKKIGIMYIIVAVLMFFRGGLDAGMIWFQQAFFVGSTPGYLTADHFQQVLTAHGDIMVFFVTMGFLFGLLNLIVPLQIGARDLAFPFLNTLGFWLYVAGAILINLFFAVGGDFAATGWLAVAPLSDIDYSPGVGVDYWIWSLQVSGLGTLLGGLNFAVTILKMRAPGMTLMRMPMFTWTSLCSSVIILCIFPILTATMTLLYLDRTFGMHFFTTTAGGNAMMYSNLIWMWGHPEVYVLVIPAFGVYSEVVTTFAQKRLAGYRSMVAAAIGISFIALGVWLHHFFTMGSGADVNAAFGISTMIIVIPTGVQVFNWLSTLYQSRIRFFTPILYFLGFIFIFTLGGMAGVFLATPATDFQLHNSLFLVAHFHTMVVGAALYGIFAGITYWFPKVFGFKLNESIGKKAFWCWLIGFLLAFGPLYILGFMGATRRLDHYDPSTGWQPLFITTFIGFLLIVTGVMLQVIQILVSIKQRKQNMDTTGDPWNGRTLEWATSSPPPFYNFAVIPEVHSLDAFWEMKSRKSENKQSFSASQKIGKSEKIQYEDLHLPKNTAAGIYVSIFVFLVGFALVWHVYWLAAFGIIGATVCFLIRAFDDEPEYIFTKEEVEEYEKRRGN
jgi:cytochrome o ubiquinol oxidase subunit 1